MDPLDERLSAALDGVDLEPTSELDTAARERGRDLAAARDQLAVPAPPLDDVTRRRLLRAALDASTPSSRPAGERAWRRVRGGVVAAAVLAIIGFAGWGLSSLNLGSSNSKESGAKAGSAETSAAPSGPVNLHDVSNPVVLKRRAEAALRAASAPSASGTATTTTALNLNQTTAVPRAPTAAHCVASVPVPAGDTPLLLGTAAFHDTPAFVVVAREPTRTLVFVVARADCKLLTSQFLKR